MASTPQADPQVKIAHVNALCNRSSGLIWVPGVHGRGCGSRCLVCFSQVGHPLEQPAAAGLLVVLPKKNKRNIDLRFPACPPGSAIELACRTVLVSREQIDLEAGRLLRETADPHVDLPPEGGRLCRPPSPKNTAAPSSLSGKTFIANKLFVRGLCNRSSGLIGAPGVHGRGCGSRCLVCFFR